MNPNEELPYEPFSNEPEASPEAPAAPEARNEERPQSTYEPVQPTWEEPVQPDTTYRYSGTVRKESPYANSPYYSAAQPQQPRFEDSFRQGWQEPVKQEKPKKPKKERRSLGCGTKRVLAALLALVILAGSCGITASLVNEHWEEEMDRMEDQLERKLEMLEDQLENVQAAQSGSSISGSPVSAGDGLTPSQVYAMNVNSVVAITSRTSNSYSTGSGFIISEDGYVITNQHVVAGGSSITVTTYLGDEYTAKLVGSDEVNDVALLKVEASGLDAVIIGSSDALLVGDQVVAIGNPLGELTSTQTVGYISGKDRSVSTDGSIINMLQTDAAINSGNSGGPLFNMKGEVVGITSAKYSGNSNSGASIEGIGFAIPIDDVKGMIEDFKAYGYLKNQAYLGVMVKNLESSVASQYSLPSGSYVDSVEPGSCAEKAGIQPKDIIIAVGEHKVTGNATLTNALRRFKAGDTTTVTVYRAGAEVVLNITFDERPQDAGQESEQTMPTAPGEMPENGSFEEWFDYFSPFFGG